MMNVGFLREMLGTIAERGRQLLDSSSAVPAMLRPGRSSAHETTGALCKALLSGRGEASGVALARQILDLYATLPAGDRLAFFQTLARDFAPDSEGLKSAWAAYEAEPTPARLRAFIHSAEPPRQELFRRLNLALGGTQDLVHMREDLIGFLGKGDAADDELQSVDDDLVHLFYSWFNRGFLVLQRITWSTPADILERIIRYEAVHAIRGWDDLRSRLQPPDRRCYAFFHPSLVDDPLIFVEVALTGEIPGEVQGLLAEDREAGNAHGATTAVFYSISNCQRGLRGISFGNFLIKQVVEELSRDVPTLRNFVTLSPVPGFRSWLAKARRDPASVGLGSTDLTALDAIDEPDWHERAAGDEPLRQLILSLGAFYLTRCKGTDGKPLNPVARFHLGNGARLERLNWLGDTSPKGLSDAAGLMVNYLYDRASIEANHEAYANQGAVVASKAVERQMRNLGLTQKTETENV